MRVLAKDLRVGDVPRRFDHHGDPLPARPISRIERGRWVSVWLQGEKTPARFDPRDDFQVQRTKSTARNADRTKDIRPGLAAVAQRTVNAEERFITYAQERAGLTRKEAERALAVYRKAKVIKIDRIVGQFTFTHGAYGDVDVLRRAAGRDV